MLNITYLRYKSKRRNKIYDKTWNENYLSTAKHSKIILYIIFTNIVFIPSKLQIIIVYNFRMYVLLFLNNSNWNNSVQLLFVDSFSLCVN